LRRAGAAPFAKLPAEAQAEAGATMNNQFTGLTAWEDYLTALEKLPPITYRSGDLENAEIRKRVCDILEGGEAAFQERVRRLRLCLER